jgi:arylsulfatase A-like enzyme
MQASVPELTDTDREPASTYALYGEEAKKPGTFANTVLLARRMIERGVRFIQIYHNNWDTHANVSGRLPDQCRDVDQPCWGLIQDLKSRGLLDETLVIWGGEFGRTVYSQGGLSHENYGRDHHPRCFTMWMAGGGSRPGTVHGETDDFSYNIVRDPVHIHDFHATVLELLGFDHSRFTFRHQGLDQKLTGVEPAKVIKALLA